MLYIQLIAMADSTTERLRVLLPASIKHVVAPRDLVQSSLYRSYVPYPVVVDVCGLSNEINTALK